MNPPDRDHPAAAGSRQARLRAFRGEAEDLILQGAARGIEKIRTPASFSLHRLAASMVSGQTPSVAVLTGFPIVLENGDIRFENDGPIGACMMAGAFAAFGWPCVVLSDCMAEAIITQAIEALPEAGRPDSLFLDGEGAGNSRSGKALRADLVRRGVTHVIAIERPGRARDGQYYNMRAQPIGGHIIPADFLFDDVPWQTAGFADGGNEIGMGKIGVERIARNIDRGATIVSRTKVDFLTLCGVSNWGAYGLLSALAVAEPAHKDIVYQFLSARMNRALFAACKRGGAVDGVTRRQTQTVDNVPLAVHDEKIAAFRALAERLTQRRAEAA